MSNLQYFSTLCEANAARQKEWDANGQISASYRGNELAGEAGEALEVALQLILFTSVVGKVCNIVKKLDRERLGIRGSRETVEHLAEELSDARICLDLVAQDFGINLDHVTAIKFNKTSEANRLKTRMTVPADALD